MVPTPLLPDDPTVPFSSLDPNLSDLDVLPSDIAIQPTTVWAFSPIAFLNYQEDLLGDVGVYNRNGDDRSSGTGLPWEVTVTENGVEHPALAGKTGTFQ